MSEWIELAEAFAVGDTKTLQIDCYYDFGDNRGSICTLSSVLVHGYDVRDRAIQGTVDAGSTTTLGDSSVLTGYNDDDLIGLPLRIWDSGGREYETEITDSDGTTGFLTFTTCGVTPASGDYWAIDGVPLLVQTSGTASSNRASYQISRADMTAYPGRRAFVMTLTLEDGDVEECVFGFEVRASRPR